MTAPQQPWMVGKRDDGSHGSIQAHPEPSKNFSKHDEGSQGPNQAKSWQAKTSAGFSWGQRPPTAVPSRMSSGFEGDFTTESHQKPSTLRNMNYTTGAATTVMEPRNIISPPDAHRSYYDPQKRVCASISPPSAAAAKRAGVYDKRNLKPASGYKAVRTREVDTSNVERPRSGKFSKESFRPGMIIQAVHHEQDFRGTSRASNMTTADRFRTDSQYGPIFTKYRKLIVLALFQDHYLAIPLYTHNGRGLDNKAQPEEFVSVQDHRATEPFTKLSIHDAILTEHLYPYISPIHLKSVAHITYPVSRRYGLPVSFEGHLKKASFAHLMGLFNSFFPARPK